MKNLDDKNYFVQNDDKGKVIVAIVVAIALFVVAIGIFFCSYANSKEKLTNSSEGNKYNTVNNSVYEENKEDDEDKNDVKEAESNDSNISENNAEKETDSKTNFTITEAEDDKSSEKKEKVKNTLENFLNAVRDINSEEACNYAQNNKCDIIDIVDKQLNTQDDSIVQYNMFFKKMMDYDYEIESIRSTGDKAEGLVYIKTYNFTTKVLEARLNVSDKQATSLFGGPSLSESDKKKIAQDEVGKVLNNMDRKLKIPVIISLNIEDGEWKIKPESIDNGLKAAILKNLFDSIESYNDFYVALNNKEIDVISVQSFIDYLESKGIHYEEDGELSPFDN